MKLSHLRFFLLILVVLLLSGCMYPKNELAKNQIPNDIQLEKVQQAIDSYREQEKGLLPIKTKPSDTPIFEKHLIEFGPMLQKGLLDSIPGNAFENGGYYQYSLVDVDENPTVKLIDLRTTEAIRSVGTRLEIYRSEHIYPPYGAVVDDGLYEIDYKKLNLDKAPTVTSPFSAKSLPIIMDQNGKLYIDYRIDLYEAIKEFDHTYKNGDDIRYLLVDHYPFVPAYSKPYTIKDGEPAFLNEK